MLKKILFYCSCFILIFFTLVAILGHFLAPDPSTFANRQIPELALLPVQSQVWCLKIPISSEKKITLWQRFLSGNPNKYYFLPLQSPKSFSLSKNKTLIYIDNTGEKKTFSLSQNFNLNKIKIIKLTFWLGTDNLGRDVLSRLIIGTRTSLFIGIVSALFSVFIGTVLGSLAALKGKWIDLFLQWIMGTLWSIPSVLLALSLSFVLGNGIQNLIITIALVSWTEVARVVRGKILELKERPFIHAARALGLPEFRIFGKHLLPNLLPILFILGISALNTAVLLEAGLSFLGFGVAPPQPTWGILISEGYTYWVLPQLEHLALLPGLSLGLVTIALFSLHNYFSLPKE